MDKSPKPWPWHGKFYQTESETNNP
jgi:hypothetical protein